MAWLPSRDCGIIDAILTNTVLPRISEEFLKPMHEGKSIERVHVSMADGELACEFE
jgi:type VI secretion system protein VasG